MKLKDLTAPFAAGDVEWRLAQAGKNDRGFWAKALAYITNRAIQDRLDEVCGPANWRNEFTTGPGGGVLCGISIRIGEEWVTKWDGAENTDVEAVKGGLSGAMKRAAVQWGIGRYLYHLPEGWATCHADRSGTFRGKTKSGEQFTWDAPALPAWALPGGSMKPDASEPAAAPPAPAQRSTPARGTFDLSEEVRKGKHKGKSWAELAETEPSYIKYVLDKWTDLSPEARRKLEAALEGGKASATDVVKLQDALNRAAAIPVIDIDQAAKIEEIIDEADAATVAKALARLEKLIAEGKPAA